MTWQSSIAIISGPDDLGLYAWHWNFSHDGFPYHHKGYGELGECRAQVRKAEDEFWEAHRGSPGMVDY